MPFSGISARSEGGTDCAFSSKRTWATAYRSSSLTSRVPSVARATARPSWYWARPVASCSSASARSARPDSSFAAPSSIWAWSCGIVGSSGLAATSWSSSARPPESRSSACPSRARPSSSCFWPSATCAPAAARRSAEASSCSCASKGSTTPVTCGSCAHVANTSRTARRWSSVNSPSSLSRTTLPKPPAAAGTSSPSSSSTLSKEVPGIDTRLLSGWPTVTASAPTPRRTTSHAASTAQACAADQRARRYSREDIGAFRAGRAAGIRGAARVRALGRPWARGCGSGRARRAGARGPRRGSAPSRAPRHPDRRSRLSAPRPGTRPRRRREGGGVGRDDEVRGFPCGRRPRSHPSSHSSHACSSTRMSPRACGDASPAAASTAMRSTRASSPGSVTTASALSSTSSSAGRASRQAPRDAKNSVRLAVSTDSTEGK